LREIGVDLERRPPLALALFESALRQLPPFVATHAITLALRAAGAQIAPSAAFWGMPTLMGSRSPATRLAVGESCGFNFGCVFELDALITFEPHVSVGHQVMFLTRTRDCTDASRRGAEGEPKPIRVGAGSWIGARAVVLPGITIGPGSVIGASIVVRENVPANTLMVGPRKISLAKWLPRRKV
jgi:maltose O-acetyltransferase